MLEILSPRHGLDAVGGLDHATRELREVADIMRRGLFSAAPLGIILMGPPGTGKTYLAECFAKECGMLCVRFRPLRGMYVGQSERNQEKAFAAIRALAPVVVIVDESDQAEGGNRDSGGGRLRRGRAHARVVLQLLGRQLPARPRPAHRQHQPRGPHRLRHAPLRAHRHQDPDPHAGRGLAAADLRGRGQEAQAGLGHHGLHALRAAHPGFTGSDIELALTTAYRFALREGPPRSPTPTSLPPSTTSSRSPATRPPSTT